MRWCAVSLFYLLPCLASAQAATPAEAIREACAAGVLTHEECQQKLAALAQRGVSAQTSPPPTSDSGIAHWSEPHGRYTIAIAPGWHVDDSQGTLKVTKGSSWAIFDTESHQGSAMEVAQANAQQMQGMLSGWQVVGQSPFDTPRHHASAGVAARAKVPTRSGGENRVLTFAAQSAGGGHFVTLTASSLEPEAQAEQGRVMAMFNLIRFAGEQ